MKKLPLRSRSSSVGKVACTVSAAALMLGVSHAATVAMRFQCNYCGSPGYNGQPISLTAFGVSPGGWQNLTPMNTGYGTCTLSAPPYGYTLNETISTNTNTGGLNPLPQGTINITWSANTANFSDFGGYFDASLSPPYKIKINGNATGVVSGAEDEVYANFLRDGINFGPPGGPDNTGGFGGYSVDMTGVKSVFTNSPYVVELIAASDSMNVLTNAFVIDVGSSTTNSVSYPNTAPIANDGDAPWPRGSGGGLSTGSAQMNADHLHIMSNQPQHGGSGATGYNNAGTISGFIITDQPVVTMSPRPVPVGLGDTVTWSAYAVGVPPLSIQWLKNGVPIPAATSFTLSLTNVTAANVGNYALLVTNAYGSATSSVVSVDSVIQTQTTNLVLDSNPEGPAHNGLNSNATWLASFTDPNGTNITGVMSFNGSNSQITVPAFSAFNATNGTVMFWMQTTQNQVIVGSAMLVDRYNETNNTGPGLRIIKSTAYIQVQFGSGTLTTFTTPVNDGNWHHVAVAYDLSGVNGVSVYIDGTLDPAGTITGTAFSWQTNQEVDLGNPHTIITSVAYEPFQGLMSDFRIYTTNLSASQIASVYSSGALADTNDLAARLSFATPPSQGLLETFQVPDGILQSAPLITGPWTDVGVLQPLYLTLPSKPVLFYRYRGHTPVTQVSNPFLM